jgi:hypothetical protein
MYVDAPEISAENAAGLSPGTSSPEAAVVHYFASRIRGDTDYEQVLAPPEHRESRLDRAVEEHNSWQFTGFRLVGRKDYRDGILLIQVWFSIEYNGRTDSGTDEAAVQQFDGQWYVVGVPT